MRIFYYFDCLILEILRSLQSTSYLAYFLLENIAIILLQRTAKIITNLLDRLNLCMVFIVPRDKLVHSLIKGNNSVCLYHDLQTNTWTSFLS